MESKLILLVVVVLLAAVAEGGGSYFKIHRRMNYNQAKAACAHRGARLAVILDAKQNNNALLTIRGSTKYFWIGANDIKKEGTWVWPSGNSVCFSNWFKGEPNDWGRREDCAFLNYGGKGQWADANCNAHVDGAICQHHPMPKEYFKIDRSMNYQEAKTTCGQHGARLAIILDAKQNAAAMASLGGSTKHYWIDTNDIKKEKDWRWSDGNKLCFSYWAAGEPNNAGKNEDCAFVNYLPNGRWADVNCNRRLPGAICEHI